MPIKRDYGLKLNRNDPAERSRLISYINLKLAGMGLPVYSQEGTAFLDIAQELITNYREKTRLLADYLPPADARIQAFLDGYCSDLAEADRAKLPSHSLVLDRYGMARELSLPPDAQEYVSPTLSSYRVRNGVLHNPANDRRTTEGVFHVAEGGLPVPPDKKAVPKLAFARLLKAAFQPPEDMLVLPFTAHEAESACTFLSLLLRPLVRPEVPGLARELAMELRFFAPASLAANLDFVESIFGNSGDPYIAENDAALDPLYWTGHTGCIVLATHLINLTKKDLGLPNIKDATERQKLDGMCWKAATEKYNDGKPFKICARDERGVIVTVIADNYFGYSKKEVKTQISYSSNLLGLAEEEHAGGALVMPSFNLGTRFIPDTNLRSRGQTFDHVIRLLGNRISLQPEGYAIDCTFDKVIYLPEDAVLSLVDQAATWRHEGQQQSLRILPDEVYIHPTGFRIVLSQHPQSGSWRLVGTSADGILCHKPCTVSGGGKSEISKSITDAITTSPLVTGDFNADMAQVKAVIEHRYGGRFQNQAENHGEASRSILSSNRSLGSVIKLLSPSPLNTGEFNAWLSSIPERVKALVFLVKRFYRPEWGDDWQSHFDTDVVNGSQGNVIKYEGRPIQASYLRVGFTPEGARSIHKLRQDYMPAAKIQWEDDITASVVVPTARLTGLPEGTHGPGIKFARNCEARFFQRPDDAIHRGYDKQAEADMSRLDNFISNFEPLSRSRAGQMLERTVELTEYTRPMQQMIIEAERDSHFRWFVASSHPRMVDGKPSKNPRYLQLDRNYQLPMDRYLADVGARLYRMIPADQPIHHPVVALLPGRRNNPPDREAGIRPLAVYNPIHFQELPELFMDFICSLTGKSPSTTGAGSEGALTKGPFNALVPTTDLNNALLGYILCGYDGFTSAAGYIGHKYKVDHDVSLLMPELWARMTPEERSARFLIDNGYLEKVEDFEYQGTTIPASRLGYRVTPLFAAHMLGRLFDAPSSVFPNEVLKPELQSLENFADGILNIAEAQRKAASQYLADGSVNAAIPPLKAILHIMAKGDYEGKTLDDPAVRQLFELDYVLRSPWYISRLASYAISEKQRLERGKMHMEQFLANASHYADRELQPIRRNLQQVEELLSEVNRPDYADSLIGTIGKDPLFHA
ncbi:MAG: hypothetical protein A2087_01220 [Spirochaetes bacterium GWD1_61_31]|nr:MAG: hypothetical protein A2Y37_12815 [Spirochaetes bacterium GWB1_60_80]OHD28665.1 MAG: hypothetical protein A2004_05760 [Spirochaetes bacterium GWC1_61_12]OHD34952.1 MAG: hypothetical protein A2087_01220 [Spirochaetes bacterium GWD1_61_31]OHD43307.1 MAG: hypothetical protein A2Y35_08510 [Spirochaetes bacterium GWE1_60_18]OHD58845.1 MAG: hypothetical protein A2Y32_08880 [Spirochaetes bacterium GWF1_60_12]HAP42499.1 hypothetical protein [Spirochaetaceae bacterium]